MRSSPDETYLRSDRTNYLNYGNENTGQDAFRRSEEEALQGSRALRERMEKLFFRFAWRHGISPEEARFLLLNTGVKVKA